MHCLDPHLVRLFAMEQVKEVTTEGFIVRLKFDAFLVCNEVMPIQEHRSDAC